MLAIYTRLSKEDDQSTSIENQKREGKEFFDLHNFTNHKIYDEGEGVSGTLNIEDRPELLSLINDIKKGTINAVWMRNQNRLDRNTSTFIVFIDAVKKKDVDVYFGSSDKLDFNDATTLLQSTILSSLNQYQAQLQSQQTKKALRDNAKLGKVWGVLPYGYSSDLNMMPYVNKDEAKIVNRIFNEYLKGKGVRAIASALNEDKIPTKYNKYKNKTISLRNKYTKKVTKKSTDDIVWVEKTLTDILKNKWYIGERKYSGQSYKSPEIVDKALFNKVQKAIESRKGVRTSRGKYNYLLKGLLRCGKCGRNYYGKKRADKRDNYYMCSSNRSAATKCGNVGINIPKLESFIIKHLFKSRDLLDYLKNNNKDNDIIKSLKEELLELGNKCKANGNKQTRLLKLLLDTDLQDDDMIKNQYKNAKKQESELKIKTSLTEDKINNISSKKGFEEYSDTFDSVKNNLDFETIKEAVNKLISNIIVDTHVEKQSSSEKDWKVRSVVEIEYKSILIGEMNSLKFITERPMNVWSCNYRFFDTKNDSYIKGLDKDLNENIVHSIKRADSMFQGLALLDFKLAKTFYDNGVPKEYVSKGANFDTIFLDKEDIYDFNG